MKSSKHSSVIRETSKNEKLTDEVPDELIQKMHKMGVDTKKISFKKKKTKQGREILAWAPRNFLFLKMRSNQGYSNRKIFKYSLLRLSQD